MIGIFESADKLSIFEFRTDEELIRGMGEYGKQSGCELLIVINGNGVLCGMISNGRLLSGRHGITEGSYIILGLASSNALSNIPNAAEGFMNYTDWDLKAKFNSIVTPPIYNIYANG